MAIKFKNIFQETLEQHLLPFDDIQNRDFGTTVTVFQSPSHIKQNNSFSEQNIYILDWEGCPYIAENIWAILTSEIDKNGK